MTIPSLLFLGIAKLSWGFPSNTTTTPTTAPAGLSFNVPNQPPPQCYGQEPPVSVFGEDCNIAIRDIERTFVRERTYIFTKLRFPGDRFRTLSIRREKGTCYVRIQFQTGRRYARFRWEAIDTPLRALWRDCARVRGSGGFVYVDGESGPLALFITRIHPTSSIEDAGAASINTTMQDGE